MTADVAAKEFEAGLSLLHMMLRPSEASSSGSDSPSTGKPVAATKKRQGGAGAASTPRPAKKARVKAVSSLLLAAAQQVDPKQGQDDDADEDDDDDCEDGSEWGGDTDGSSRGAVRRNAQLNTLTRELTIDELREHFNKPIVDVAKEFGICTTFLKKICRRCGIKRWPHRQIRSLTRTMEMLRQAETNATSVQEKTKYAAQIAHVEAKMQAVIEDPDANGKLERVKKSVLNRSGSPGSRKNSTDATPRNKNSAQVPQEPVVQVDLLHAVAVAAAAAQSEAGSAPIEVATPITLSPSAVLATTDAEAVAAEALLFSASPRTPMASIDVNMPAVDLGSSVLPATTPTASSTPQLAPQRGLKISPSHRKILTVSKCEGDVRVRSSSLGSLQDLEDSKQLLDDRQLPVTLASSPPATMGAVEAS